jgi:cytochrome c oxidase cbb3-type subunit I
MDRKVLTQAPGHAEDPAAEPGSLAALQNAVELKAGRAEPLGDAELAQRARADRSSVTVAFVFLSCATGWLLLRSFAGLIASIKLHEPDWLTDYEWLTFGRIRTIHRPVRMVPSRWGLTAAVLSIGQV